MKILFKNLLFSLWFVISSIERIYWLVWRNVQIQKFKQCGKKVFIDRYCHFTCETISIGDDVYIGQGCRFQSTGSKIFIGSHVMFGPDVSIHGGDHRIDLVGRFIKEIKLVEKKPINDQDVIIEDDVWIGGGAIILKGVIIGEGSVIGAGSVVTRNVLPYTILVGSKSQKEFERWSQEEITRHKNLIAERKRMDFNLKK